MLISEQPKTSVSNAFQYVGLSSICVPEGLTSRLQRDKSSKKGGVEERKTGKNAMEERKGCDFVSERR